MSSRHFPRGLPAERTGLAWQRTALGSGAVSLLLLYHTGDPSGGALAAAAACAGATTVVLAVAGGLRARRLRHSTPPRPVPAAVLATVAILVSTAAILAFFGLG